MYKYVYVCVCVGVLYVSTSAQGSQKKTSGLLDLELQAAVSHPTRYREPNTGPLDEHNVLSITEKPLQPHDHVLKVTRSWQDGSEGKAFTFKPDNLSLIPGTHVVEGYN